MRKGILFSALCLIAIVAVACGGNNAATGNGGAKGGNSAGNAACGSGDDGSSDGCGDSACGDASDSASTDGDDGGDAADAYALYRTVGNTWTLKSVSKMGDMAETVSYTKTEVIAVTDEAATIKTTMMDADMKVNEYVPPSETEIKFVTASADGTDGTVEIEQTEESVTVEAGTFNCIKTEVDTNGMKTTSWSSKDYPGLTVKSVTEGETSGMTMNSTTELVEWKEG